MLFFDFLSLLNADINPSESKIHLAISDGKDNPLDLYRAGEFEEWQRRQNQKSFSRKYVITLIRLPEPDKWLFAGVYTVNGDPGEKNYEYDGEFFHHYSLVEDESCTEMKGKLTVSFKRGTKLRNSYLYGETLLKQMFLHEVRAERLTIADFPGFKFINLSRKELEMIVCHKVASWQAALSCVSGVYLISDTASGKLYVGKASGKGGLWQRWSDYVAKFHGGNAELEKLIKENGVEYVSNFRYSVLEIADTHTSEEELCQRDSHWKNILLSRSHGLNAN